MTLEEIQEGKIFLIDKPLEWTSFQVVKKLKYMILKKFNIKKIKVGHAGTLDPLARGLLIVCTGKATKKILEIQSLEKEYTGEIRLGAETPSYDLETDIVNTYCTKNITKQEVLNCAKKFEGKILQKPPIFSALRKDGKRLYEFAREGKEVDITPREVNIKKFDVEDFENDIVKFRIQCGKGTYIRSIAHDFGKKLNNGAHLNSLKRESIGEYKISDAHSMENLKNIFS